MKIALIIIGIFILADIILAARAAIRIVYPVMKTDEHFAKVLEQYHAYDPDWYNNLEKDEFYIQSQYGYRIHLTYVKNPASTEHTIIVSHGVTSRSEGVRKYLKMFIDNGYNALFIDHRAHGKTGGKKVSYGYFEKYDMASAIKWVKERHSGKIGMIGESMGAGILMQALSLEKVDFIIEDCGYSSFGGEIKHRFRRNKYVPLYPTYYITRFLVLIMAGYDMEKVSPVEAIKHVDIPIMIVHGEEDDYVPFYMASILYDNINSDKKAFYVAEGSKHALAYEDHQQEYPQRVQEFLEISEMPYV
ncbi:MAG: alpha/beta hydrolase [Clostridia bacterium]|nr:alpha/beta hydrolase [Clostridia bacterium]